MMMQHYKITSMLTILVITLSYSSALAVDDYSDEDSDYLREFDDKYDPAMHVGSDESDNPPGPLNLRGSLRRRFAMDAALANPDNSLVCSPLSALLPLGKLALGATGECLAQLLTAIGVSRLPQLHDAFEPLLSNLVFLRGVTLNVVSKIYVSNEHRLTSKFKKRAKRIFNSTVETVDFKKPDVVVSDINNWVSTKTQNMISNVISDNDITPWTSLILVNAVYFSGKWMKSFKKAREENFYTSSVTTKVPMMSRDGIYNYSKSDHLDAQIVEIPYEGGEASLVIILPNSKDTLSIMLDKIRLAPELMQKAVAKLVPTDITLKIPKFTISSKVDLNIAYKQLGVTEMFQQHGSGLDNIVKGEKKVFVSRAVQKAVIEVSEQGTKAAASSILIGQKSLYITFTANRPFMYFVKFTDNQIFTGTYLR